MGHEEGNRGVGPWHRPRSVNAGVAGSGGEPKKAADDSGDPYRSALDRLIDAAGKGQGRRTDDERPI